MSKRRPLSVLERSKGFGTGAGFKGKSRWWVELRPLNIDAFILYMTTARS
jgi:hypothetical protein